MKTAREIINDMKQEMPFHIHGMITPYIEEAMKIYGLQCAENALNDAANNAEWGICQNDDGQEPCIHKDNIFIDRNSILNTKIETP